MRLIGAFVAFARRVVETAKAGGLGSKDLKKLDHLLSRTGKRNTILAKGILSALSAGGAGEKDIARFGELIGRANERISNGKEPFTPKELKEVTNIFKRAYISHKTARWFNSQLDELVAEQINEFITGTRSVDITGVPMKTTIPGPGLEQKTEEEQRKRRQRA